jgi:hypothetical protein
MTIEQWERVEQAVNDTCVVIYTLAELARQVISQAARGLPVREADYAVLKAFTSISSEVKELAAMQFKADMEAIALAGMLDMPQRELARLDGITHQLDAAYRTLRDREKGDSNV